MEYAAHVGSLLEVAQKVQRGRTGGASIISCKRMGQLASCACGALAGCFCREIEKTVENQVRSAVNAELALLREELASCGYCHTSNCATRS